MECVESIINVLIDGYSAGFCRRNVGDYVADDGLLHCGKCKEAKQRYYNGRLIGRQCKCVRDAVNAKIKEIEKEKAKEKIAALKKASLMTGILADARFNKCKRTKFNERNLDICKRYVEKFDELKKANQGLLFWGAVGTGKSYAAACIANELIDKGHSVVMTSLVRLIDMSQDDNFDVILRRMLNCDLVILDDFGAERDTSFALEKAYYVIESRHRQGKPMIVTTNLLLEDMRNVDDERYARTYDRVLDVCYPMQWTGPSWRKVQAKDKFAGFEETLGLK